MLLYAVAAAVGLLVGLVRAPLGSHLPTPRLNWPVFAVAGIALHLAPIAIDGLSDGWFLALGLACLAAFAVGNLHLVGMGVVTIGLASNLTVVAVNGAMPVRAESVIRADVTTIEELPFVDLGIGRRFERTDDVLPVLGDIIPIELTGSVVSFGDLVILMGVIALIADLTRQTRFGPRRAGGRTLRRRAGSSPSSADEPDDEDVIIDLTRERVPAPVFAQPMPGRSVFDDPEPEAVAPVRQVPHAAGVRSDRLSSQVFGERRRPLQ